jgi:hypothetical protein
VPNGTHQGRMRPRANMIANKIHAYGILFALTGVPVGTLIKYLSFRCLAARYFMPPLPTSVLRNQKNATDAIRVSKTPNIIYLLYNL